MYIERFLRDVVESAYTLTTAGSDRPLCVHASQNSDHRSSQWRSNDRDGQGGQSPGPPSVQTPHHQVPGKLENNLTELQIFGCELHENAFGGRAPPGPTGDPVGSAPPDSLAL